MGPGEFFPTNSDLADILGDTDFDFENLIFSLDFLGSQILRFPGPRFPEIRPGAGLGPAWAWAWARAWAQAWARAWVRND